MSSGILGSLAAAALVTWVAMGAARPAAGALSPGSAADTATVLDGVFTRGQAARGKDVFEVTCMRCHALAEFTAGAHAPTKKWSTVGALFGTVRARMPYDDPGSLSTTDYAAVVSYILQENGYPARDVELSTDVRKLLPIRIVPLPLAAPDSLRSDGPT